jgi:hypothetical protein
MADIDFKGKDWNSQIKFGQPGFYGESNTQLTQLCNLPTAALACFS